MLITIVAGARPNFMKIAPIIEEIQNKRNLGFDISFRLVHTGQHYDKNMSENFFKQLRIPLPDVNLNVGSGSQTEQTAAIMLGFEIELSKYPPDLVIVVGDVNSTMACSIVAKKMCIKVAHVEAGIRSGDLGMPEEINRIVTDSLTDYFFITSDYAKTNLKNLGVNESKIFFVGNTMIDTLVKQEENFLKPAIWNDADLFSKNYFVLTLHRPSNVDFSDKLETILKSILQSAPNYKIIFPVHPRTRKVLDQFDLGHNNNLILLQPLSYLEFNYLVKHSLAVVTDSGGITEEATFMGIPCMTLRDSTERPETCVIGTNVLLGSDPSSIAPAFEKLFLGKWQKGAIPYLWDGHASERIIDHVIQLFNIKMINIA